MEDNEQEIQKWKIKRVIKNLDSLKGNGTSMISLVIPAGDQVARYQSMLTTEFGTASNIKSRVNRLSVLSAITSTQQRLKLYNKAPPNGLVIYSGTVTNADGKEKKMTIDFEPFKPINKSLYMCDNCFHTECLSSLLESDDKYGFIVIGGDGTLFGTLTGNYKETLYELKVDLPKKHKKGGQSSVRFARLRVEARHNYLRKVCELSVQNFIENDLPNVTGLVIGGPAEFKTELVNSDMFDQRLKKIVIKLVDTSYGGSNGFNQAIDLSADALGNLKFIKEKQLLGQFMEEIAKDTGKICYGIKDTIYALESGAVEKLIVWEDSTIVRYVLKNSSNDDEKVVFHNPEQIEKMYEANEGYTLVDELPFTEWIAENYKTYGTELNFVSDKSQEGNQFCCGFGGIGGLLRYQLQFEYIDDYDDDDDFDGFI